jgi:hypothetical protein
LQRVLRKMVGAIGRLLPRIALRVVGRFKSSVPSFSWCLIGNFEALGTPKMHAFAGLSAGEDKFYIPNILEVLLDQYQHTSPACIHFFSGICFNANNRFAIDADLLSQNGLIHSSKCARCADHARRRNFLLSISGRKFH